MPKARVREFDPNELYPLPEDTLLTVQLIDCIEDNVEFTYKRGDKAGQKGGFLKWKWSFVVVDGEYQGTEVTGSTEPKITSAVDTDFLPLARPYVEALLGRQLETGEEIDTDDLVGLQAKVTVRHLEPRPRKNGEGNWYNVEIADVFPLFGDGQTIEQMASVGEPPY